MDRSISMPKRHQGPSYFTRTHQFGLAEEALHEARHHLKAKWYSSSIVHSFQVAHRAAAGLLFERGAKIFTEAEVRYGFSAQFVVTGKADGSLLEDYDELERMRLTAEREYDYTASREEAEHALSRAERFWAAAQQLRRG